MTLPQVRFTRVCEYTSCQRPCAIIQTIHPNRAAMTHSTLELMQSPAHQACDFDVHVWVPFARETKPSAEVEFLMLTDGVRGQFAIQPDLQEEFQSRASELVTGGSSDGTIRNFMASLPPFPSPPFPDRPHLPRPLHLRNRVTTMATSFSSS